jgi:hypothetical protein
MQTQIQRMGGMSSAVIGGFCKHSPVVHELVAKFADMTHDRQGNGEGARARVARCSKRPQHTSQRRHRIRQRLATGACRDFHENKIARLPYVDPSTEYARAARFATAPPAGVGRAVESEWRAAPEKNRAQPHSHPWDAPAREWAAQQGATCPLVASPRPRSPGCGRAAGSHAAPT